MSLRDHIKEKHDKAEKHRFVALLLSGYIPQDVYCGYLANQLHCYTALETRAQSLGLFDNIEAIKRSEHILRDMNELGGGGTIHTSTAQYCQYVETLDADRLWAHIYARHFADMYGGQLIKKCVPGAGTMYEFEGRSDLIAKVRAKLTDDMADEANRVFEYVLALYDEMANEHDLQTA